MGVLIRNNIVNQKGTPAFYEDTLTNRPVANLQGRMFVSIDTAAIYRDTGSAWVLIADATGPVTGFVPYTGATANVDLGSFGFTASSLSIPTLTTGSVLFAGSSGLISQDNTNLFWDDTNNFLGIGPTGGPTALLDIHSPVQNIFVQLNATSTNNSQLAFLNGGVGKWRIGNLYNAAANDFHVFDTTNSISRLTIKNTGVSTLISNFSATKTATYSSGGVYGIYGNDNYTIPASTSFGSGGLIFAGLQGIQSFTYGGNATYDNSALNGGVVGINQLQFSSTGTITMTQATGVRAMTAGVFQNQFNGSVNGTITHLAGLQILGNYKGSTGIATITNAYGLLINNIDDYTSGFAFTNRWGIYQAGVSDANYFAGKIVTGSTTVGTDQLQVTGSSKFTGTITMVSNAINWGTNFISNGIILYDGGTSTNRIGIGVTSAGGLGLFSRVNSLWLSATNDAATMSTSNAQIQITNTKIEGIVTFVKNSVGNAFIYDGGITTNRYGIGISTNGTQIFTGSLNPNILFGVGYDSSNLTKSTSTMWMSATSLMLGTDTEVITSILTLASTTKGFLPPRMTTAQKNAIATPATGLVVYDTTLNKLALYTGAAWETVTSI
jgi:hypothetical protein